MAQSSEAAVFRGTDLTPAFGTIACLEALGRDLLTFRGTDLTPAFGTSSARVEREPGGEVHAPTGTSVPAGPPMSPPASKRARRAVWRPWRSLRQAEEGLSSLELALIVPVFLLLVLGTFDLGRAVMFYNIAGQAAREGARAGMIAVPPNSNPALPPTLTSGHATTIRNAALAQAGPFAPLLTITPTAGLDTRGPYVQVVVTATFVPALRQFLGLPDIPLRATSRVYLP